MVAPVAPRGVEQKASREPARETLAPTMLGFGAVPGTPEEARSHVQVRVRAYVGLCASLWVIVYLGEVAVRGWVDPTTFQNASRAALQLIHVGCAVTLVLVWLALGRGRWSLRRLDGCDVLVTFLQAAVLATLHVLGGEPRFRTELVVMLGATNLLAGRAALVPCTAWRTAVLGALVGAPQPFATYWVFTHRMVPPDFPKPLGVSCFIGIWCVLALASSVAVTSVIYGLERRVRQASQLGQYTLEKQLATGGMGVVYLARHALLRRPTAVKLLPPDKAGKASIQRFEREVQLTSQLTHPNIVAVYDYGRTPDGVFYYAMEYLEGIDLEHLVRDKGALPPARVRHIIRQVADALAVAHAVNLIHRDVKPANIVLLNRGRQQDVVKVLDFGLVKEATPTTGHPSLSSGVSLIGTPLYVSPETISDPRKVDQRSDLYALGSVAYYLLTGKHWVKGKTLVEVCAAHLYEKPEPPSQRLGRKIPESLEALVLKCLAKDPADRPQSAAELVEILDAATDVPAWTPADARAAWATSADAASPVASPSTPPNTPAEPSTDDTPVPASRALAVDLEHR
ncbi:MAG: serine/threonine-protein kinase [Polyangiaceae bacterium]